LGEPTTPASKKLEEAPEVITISDSSEMDPINDPDKENRTSADEGLAKSPLLLPKTLPVTTPIARLAWQDLMGISDAPKDEEDISPGDRLLWHNEKDVLTSALSPMLNRRGKKRARSSSPTSSPGAAGPKTPAVNVKELRKALKSPYADPTLELWDRFSMNGATNSTPIGIKNPALAHLMVSSSPRPPKSTATPQVESSLRRAISCGVQWPKRRRTERQSDISPADPSQRDRSGLSKASMVTALLETVNGEIGKSDASQEQDGSPTLPCLGKGVSRLQQCLSPSTRAKDRLLGRPAEPREPLIGGDSCDVRMQGSSSDYGDDEFDEDTFMEIDASLPPIDVGSSAAELSKQAQQKAPSGDMAAEDVEDEFDNIDDDIFAEAEGLVVDLDSTKLSHPVSQTPRANATTELKAEIPSEGKEEAEDFFGDDFGENIDFEAMELAATQPVKSTSASLSLQDVRITG
jgi:DNA replication ATP-dependent helicase Dna2